MFAHDLGIDVWEAIDAASTKPFGFMRFTPGPGVGGHCLPIDPSYLSWRVQAGARASSFRFVELANDVNNHMPDYVVRRLIEALNDRRRSVNGSRILLLGLAYKKNTGDARESPAARVAELLPGMGAEVRAADPHVVAGVHVAEPGIPGQRAAADPTAARWPPSAGSTPPPRSSPPPTRSSCSPTTTTSTTTAVTEHARYVLDCRRRLTGVGGRGAVTRPVPRTPPDPAPRERRPRRAGPPFPAAGSAAAISRGG